MRIGTGALATASLSGLLLIASGDMAAAQQPPAQPPAAPAEGGAAPKQQAWMKPCEADAQKLCKEQLKSGDVPSCLASHEKELSEECTSAFLWRYKVAQACKDDIEKLCKDNLKAGMPLGQCFKEKDKELSAGCKSALVKGSKKSRAEEKAAGAAEKTTATAGAEGAAAKETKPKSKKKKE
jgi:hypothetical protein